MKMEASLAVSAVEASMPEDALRRLAAAILVQAVEDAKSLQRGAARCDWFRSHETGPCAVRNRAREVTELMAFFKTRHFEALCELCDVDGEVLRERVGVGERVGI